MKELDLSAIGARMATTPMGETRIINMPPSEVVQERPRTLIELAQDFKDHPKWRDFASRYPNPVIREESSILEADRENPFGNEGRGFFNPEESEGRYE